MSAGRSVLGSWASNHRSMRWLLLGAYGVGLGLYWVFRLIIAGVSLMLYGIRLLCMVIVLFACVTRGRSLWWH